MLKLKPLQINKIAKVIDTSYKKLPPGWAIIEEYC